MVTVHSSNLRCPYYITIQFQEQVSIQEEMYFILYLMYFIFHF
nr:MAG TPA: hypothetical protein [Caudoviricetes sp.]